MESHNEVEVTDSPDSGDSPREDAMPFEGAIDPRLRRINEYLQAALAKQDALQANLSAANADLMTISYKLVAVIKETMDAAPASLEAYEELGPAISDLLRIHKQIDRFSTLDNRLASTKALALSHASAVIERSEETTS
jgi:hypothetical protein